MNASTRYYFLALQDARFHIERWRRAIGMVIAAGAIPTIQAVRANPTEALRA